MFDLNILCVGQEMPTINIPGNECIWIGNVNDQGKQKPKYYFEIAPLMNFIDGIWYELLCSEDELGGTNICDYSKNIGVYPYWINNEIKGDLQVLEINRYYYESFKNILIFLIEKSPIHRIILFCRYQSNDQEVFCGTIIVEEFLKLLDSRKILTKVCYCITEKNGLKYCLDKMR